MTGFGKWWYIRRGVMLAIIGLFLASAWWKLGILTGNYSASTLLGYIPMADPLGAAQAALATGGLGQKAVIGAGVTGLLYLLAGGRAFCGWVCPLGALFDLAHWISGKLSIKKPFAGFPSVSRFYFLAAVLIAAPVSGVALYEMYNPISILGRAALFTGAGIGLASWMILGMLALYELALARAGWCKNLCPLGAFYSLLGRVSPLRVAVDKAMDDPGRLIGQVCPEPGVIPGLLGREPYNGLCTMCGACVDRSGGAIRFSWSLNQFKRG